METKTALRHLLKSLCQDTPWNYTVLWKLRQQNHLLLTWEDWYFDNEKSDEYISVRPQTYYFGCEMDTICETSPRFPIAESVSCMSYHSYPLGEGVVGAVASMRKHLWVFSSEYDLQPQFPEEWQLQFEAGIKTVLLVPVIPLGVVQLGSLDTVLEDLSEITRISEFFRTAHHNAITCISSAPRMDQLDSYAPFAMPSVENHAGLLSQVSSKNDCVTYDVNVETQNELSSVMSYLSPTMAQADLSLPKDISDQILEVNTNNYTDESIWKSTCTNLYVDDIGGHQLNHSTDNYNSVDGDLSIFTCLEDKLNVNPSTTPRWASEQSITTNPSMKDLGGEKYDYGFENETDDRCFSFPFDSELHRALGIVTHQERKGCEWNTFLSKTDEWNSSASIWQTEMSKAYSPTFEEADTWSTKGATDQLLGEAITDFLDTSKVNKSGSSRCIRSCSNSSCKSADSCLTQCKTDDATVGFGDSLSWSHKRSTPDRENESLISSPTRFCGKSVTPLVQGQHGIAHGILKRETKSAYSSITRGNRGNADRPKPRDRQLIQDRIKELRELIPNGSKCSIDALLDQTIKHMTFLQSIPCQAEKLRFSERPKVKGEEWRPSGAQAGETGGSWVYEVGHKSADCPLIVENLDQPGQILIEMQCNEYGLFLDIAQAIKRLRLTIIKSILETRSTGQWAHFIAETPKGFHRMDILWPLVHLLQRNNIAIPNVF